MTDPLSAWARRGAAAMQAALLPACGILLLIVINVVGDLLRDPSPGVFGPGAFLHIGWHEGGPVGAVVDVVNHASKIVILAMGMSMVLATRGVDLSVGSIMAVSGAIAATLVVGGLNAAAAIGIALAASLVCGIWNGMLVAGLRLQPFVATLVLMVAGRGIAQMITSGQVVTFQDPVLTYLGNGRPAWAPVPMPVLVAIAMLALTALATRRTAVGMMIEVVGDNPHAARLSGVRSGLVIGGAYAFCGLCAGVAGLMVASNIKAADPHHAGLMLELSAIFAVVVGGGSLSGGRFSLLGAALGGLLMQMITTTIYARNISADVAPLPVAMIILVVCIAGSPAMREWWRWRRQPAESGA